MKVQGRVSQVYQTQHTAQNQQRDQEKLPKPGNAIEKRTINVDVQRGMT